MKRMKNRIVMLVLCLYLTAQTVWGAQLLVPGGQVVGLELFNDTVTVAAFDDTLGVAAKNCGLQVGDRITAINGRTIHTAEDVREALRRTDGEAEISVLRSGKAHKLSLKPEITGDGPKLGVYLRQGITGVGTVTWYDPESGSFGALGHGVNDQNGNLTAMEQGRVYDAKVITVKTGKSGTPGQLMSTVTGTGIIGSLSKNTVQGVFGKADLANREEMLPVGSKDQVRAGPATIRSTVSGSTVQEYSVEILKVYPNSGMSGRNMLLKVTDPALLAATGGIVQGMGVSYNKDNQWNP